MSSSSSSSGGAATTTAESVPLVSSLSSIYFNPYDAEHRYAALYSSFLSQHGAAPQAFIRAPGRVNLIGEHIDYMGYAVLPMAIEQDVIIAVGKKTQENLVRSVTDHTTNKTKSPAKTRAELLGGIVSQPKIFLANMKASLYESRTFGSLRDAGNITATLFQSLYGKTKWTGYVQCGLKGVLETISSSSSAPSPSELEKSVEGLSFLVDGSIPPAAGLSSSSALVCASALSLSYVFNYHFNKTKSELSDVCRRCEKYIGTEGGGMDQAISFLSERNSAQKIDFFPLRTTPVPLPEGAAFVIANSYYVSEKAQAATKHYNMRVLECKLAALLLAAHFNILAFGNDDKHLVQASSAITLKEVQEKSGRSLKELVEYLSTPMSDNVPLHAHPYNRTEIESKLSNYRNELKATFDKPFRLSDVFADNENLERAFSDSAEILLFQRALHVYGEAVRVEQFQSVCNRGVGPSGAGALLNELGTLMNESHSSCSTLFNCSCEDLEQLCASALEAGAYGARLTGAGWGGCIVALVDLDKAQGFVEQLKQKYYINFKEWKENDARLTNAIFITKPGTGAAIVQSERPFVVSSPPPPPPAPVPAPEPEPEPVQEPVPEPVPEPIREPTPLPIPEPEPEPEPVIVPSGKDEEEPEVQWGIPRSKTAWFILGLLQVAIVAAIVYAKKKREMK